MNDREDSDTYKKLADKVQHVIKLEEVVSKLNEEDFIKCDTFRYFDEVTIKNIVDVLISGADEFDKYEEIINKRKSLNWYPDYKNYYDALEQAINLFRLKDNIDYIKEKSPYEMIEAYYNNGDNSYYLIDKAYRKFYVAYDKIQDGYII
ncbi:MAG: hypothetical protein ACLT69_14840 [Intestinibacter bartlettii]